MKSITVDYGKRLAQEPEKGHNRWHEAIAPVVEAALGEEVEIQTRDAFDSQITAATTAEDLRQCDLNLVHPLTGPVFVAGAAPGDLLEVEIRDMKPAQFAYTVAFHCTRARPSAAASGFRALPATIIIS